MFNIGLLALYSSIINYINIIHITYYIFFESLKSKVDIHNIIYYSLIDHDIIVMENQKCYTFQTISMLFFISHKMMKIDLLDCTSLIP